MFFKTSKVTLFTVCMSLVNFLQNKSVSSLPHMWGEGEQHKKTITTTIINEIVYSV